MSFASLRVFTYAYPVSFLSKCHAKNRKEVLAVRTSYRKEVLALLSCSRKEVLAVSRTQAQATRNQPQEELLLADAKRSSCACIIFGLYCISIVQVSGVITVLLGQFCFVWSKMIRTTLIRQLQWLAGKVLKIWMEIWMVAIANVSHLGYYKC